MQARYADDNVAVVGVAGAARADVEAFRVAHGVTYPLLADADADLEAFGVRMIWGSEIYLLDSDGKILARGMDDVDAALAAEHGS